MSRQWYFRGKKVIALANKSDRGRIFLIFSLKIETSILVLKNVQFEHG